MAVLNLTQQDQNFSSNVEMKSKSFGIGDASAIIDILRNRMYSMPIQTLVQEYICNAKDASIEAKTLGKKQILITAPTKFACEFRVRDFGVGLSQERVENVFTLYGNSTKRDSNNQIGGYGLGAKSAWAYTDSFTVVSFYNGTKTTYLCHVGKDNVGSMDILDVQETTEENGVEIIITVKPEDMKQFNNAVRRVLAFWDNKTYKLNITIDYQKELLYKDSLVEVYERTFEHEYTDCDVQLVVDGVIFPLPKSIESKINHCKALYIHLKTGEVDIAPSREAVIDNDKVLAVLNKYNAHLKAIRLEVDSQKTIDDKVTLGAKYQAILENITFSINSELKYNNGYLELNDKLMSRRLTNKNRKLVIDKLEYNGWGTLSFKLDKSTIVIIADKDTKNVPSKVIEALKNRNNNRNEYAICIPTNNLPKYVTDKVTVLEVEKLPLPARSKTTKQVYDDSCKEILYSYYGSSLYSTSTTLGKIDKVNSFKVPYNGWKDNYKMNDFVRVMNKKGNAPKIYALKKEDFDASTLPTMEEYVEKLAKIERKKIGNVSMTYYPELAKLVKDITFPTFGSEPEFYFLDEKEKELQTKYIEGYKKIIEQLKKDFPLISCLNNGNIKEVAEYITLKQKSKSTKSA